MIFDSLNKTKGALSIAHRRYLELMCRDLSLDFFLVFLIEDGQYASKGHSPGKGARLSFLKS